jgi:hypothetical protein
MVPPPVTLEALGLVSYSQLYDLDSDDVVRRLDRVPVHEGDAFLAVMVLRAVTDLRRSAERLDHTRRGLERFMAALAVIATATTIAQVF